MTPRTFSPTGRILTVIGLAPGHGRKSELVAQMAAAWEKAGGTVRHKTLDDMATGTAPEFIIMDEATDLPPGIWDRFEWGTPQDPNSWGTADFSTIEQRVLGHMLADVTEPFAHELTGPQGPPHNRQIEFYALALGMAGVGSLASESVPRGSAIARAIFEAEERAPRMATDEGKANIPHWQQLNGAGKPWKAKRK